MMQKPELVHDIIRSVWRQSGLPCVIKTRVFPNDIPRTVEFARRAEAAGSAWFTIHGRTPDDQPSAPIRYDAVEAIRGSLKIPLVVNGGIDSLEDVFSTARRCKVGAVMAARSLLDNPGLFDRDLPPPTPALPVHPQVCCDFLRLSIIYNGALLATRHHLALMMHQLLSPAERLLITNANSFATLIRCIKEAGYWVDQTRIPHSLLA